MKGILCAVLVAACGVSPPLTVPAVPPKLELAAVDGTLSGADPAVNLAGTGASYIGPFSLDEDVGTVEVDGRTLPAVVIARSALPPAYVLYEVYALADDGFHLFWTYCRGGSVEFIYAIDSRGVTGFDDGASGTCAEVTRTSPSGVHLPAVAMDWPQVPIGFYVAGDAVDLPSGAPGAVRYGGLVQAAFTFATVDCTGCAVYGWYELHVLLWNPDTRESAVGVVYLEQRDGTHVRLDYVIDLATLQPLPGVTYEAGWVFNRR